MNLTNYFDPARFWQLLKLEVFNGRKGVFFTFAVTFGMLFFLDMLLGTALEPTKVVHEHKESYAIPLLVGGFILSSLAFNNLGSNLKRQHFLSLPVSAFERFLCMWLLTSIGWIVLFTFTYTVYTWLANPIGQMLFSDVAFKKFAPFGSYTISAMRYYFVLQGIFLVGAAHFRGYVLPKTLLVLIVCAVVCGTLVYFTMKDVFLTGHECDGDDCVLVKGIGAHSVWAIAKGMFWWVLAPLCWVVAYLGIKEQEV